MGRALIVIATDADRQKAAHWVSKAPWNTRIEFKASKRSLPQNDRLWAMLTDVATHMKALGKDFTTDQWKAIFMHACGKEVSFLPSLDGKTFLPWGQSSSDLSKQEMTDLIEFIFAWGAENGVTFNEPEAASPLPASEGEAGALETQDGPDVAPASPPPPLNEANWLRDLGRVLIASIGQESAVVVNSATGMNRDDVSQATRDAARAITKFACRACGDYRGDDRLDRDVAIQMIENRAGSERTAA